MDFPSWTPSLTVGEPHLDAQHQALFQAAARFLQAAEEGPSSKVLQETLVFLRRYTLRHFITEESFLQAAAFPELVAHRGLHARLSAALLDAEARIATEALERRTEGLRDVVLAILEHIQTEDRAYIPYLVQPETGDQPAQTPSHLPVTGFESIDRDHLCFLGLLEALHQAVMDGRGDLELPEFLDGVIQYARPHFRREEMLMELVDYPERRAHQESHEALFQDLMHLRERLEQGEGGIASEALHFFRTWLESHIGGHDMALVPYLQRLERI